MLRNITLPLLLAAACVAGVMATRTHETTAAAACLMFLGIAMLVAVLAEFAFYRRSGRFWCGISFLGGICGAILCILNLVLFQRDGVDPLLWITASGALACLLFPLVYPRLEMFRCLLVPITLVNIGLLLWLCLLMAANMPWLYPATLPLPERPPRTAQQQQDMDELIRLIPKTIQRGDKGEIDVDAMISIGDAIVSKLSSDLTPASLYGKDLTPISEILEPAQPDLDKIWTFLAEHQPVGEMELTSPVPSYLGIRYAVQLEGLRLQLEAQQGKDIRPRFRRLWRGTKNWLNVDSWMVHFMIGTALARYAAEHLCLLAGSMDQPDPEMLELLRATRESLMPAFRKALVAENRAIRQALKNPNPADNPTELFIKLIESEAFSEGSMNKLERLMNRRYFHWPFYNERDTSHYLQAILDADLAAVDSPTYLTRNKAFEERSRAIEIAVATPPRLVNLQGRSVESTVSSQWERAFQRVATTEAMLAATEQLLINQWKLPIDPLVNPLTGSPFVLGDDGSIRITEGLLEETIRALTTITPSANEPLRLKVLSK